MLNSYKKTCSWADCMYFVEYWLMYERTLLCDTMSSLTSPTQRSLCDPALWYWVQPYKSNPEISVWSCSVILSPALQVQPRDLCVILLCDTESSLTSPTQRSLCDPPWLARVLACSILVHQRANIRMTEAWCVASETFFWPFPQTVR